MPGYEVGGAYVSEASRSGGRRTRDPRQHRDPGSRTPQLIRQEVIAAKVVRAARTTLKGRKGDQRRIVPFGNTTFEVTLAKGRVMNGTGKELSAQIEGAKVKILKWGNGQRR